MLVRFQCLEKLRRAAWALLALLLWYAPSPAVAHLSTRQAGVIKHALSDLRGNVAGLVDGSGVPTFNPRYGAFGPLAAPTLNAPSFATRWLDPTGFFYFGGRYYDAATGRFFSPDPARFADSRNLYAFCGNDPVNNCDPDGMLEAQFQAAQAPALDVPQPVQSSYDASVVDRVQYHADPAADGRYGYVNRTQGGAAAAMLAMGDALGVTTLYEAMTGRNLSSGQWMTADEQRQSQIMAGVTLATLAIPVVGLESRAGVGAGGMEARAAMAAEMKAASAEMQTATLAAKGGEDILVLGRGPLSRLQGLAEQHGGHVSTINSTVPKEIFKQNYRDIRSADKIIQYMDNIPTTLGESMQIGGQYSRAEAYMINQRKDLLDKTIRLYESAPTGR